MLTTESFPKKSFQSIFNAAVRNRLQISILMFSNFYSP